MRVIGYVRVSTDDQAENGHGLAAQRDSIERWCEREGHALVALIPDVMTTRNPGRLYGREAAIVALNAGLADALVCRDLDRATRSTEDAATLLSRARSLGWALRDLTGLDTSDEEQEFMINVRIAMAQEERRKLSRRTREGMAAAKRNGTRTGAPIGRPRSIPPETERRIHELRAAGLSYKAICARLDANGTPTPSPTATRWHHSVVRDVLARSPKRTEAA